MASTQIGCRALTGTDVPDHGKQHGIHNIVGVITKRNYPIVASITANQHTVKTESPDSI